MIYINYCFKLKICAIFKDIEYNVDDFLHFMIPELQAIGFTRNEANVYLAALKLGACTVQQIAKATGLNRITVHSIVEKFEALQIFLRSYEGKRRRISAADPKRLQILLQQQEAELTTKKHSLKILIPSLDEMFLRTQRGLQVHTFQGEKGYEEMCGEILNSKTETLEYANIDALNAVIGPYIALDYLPKKFERRLVTKFLYIDTPSAREYIQTRYIDNKNSSPMEAKFVSAKTFPMDSFFVIFDDKLAIFTPGTMDGLIIRDRDVSAAMRPFFSFVWDRSGEAITNHKT